MRACPGGHPLPHVLPSGARCSPLDCADQEAIQALRGPAENPTTHAEVAVAVLAELTSMKQAWDALHPLPQLAEPEVRPIHPDYVKKRLKQVESIALERRIRRVIHDPGLEGEAAAAELLDRAGYTRKPEADINFNGPVLVVGHPIGELPWDQGIKQKTIEATKVEVVGGD